MDEDRGERIYTRAELEEVAYLGAGAGTGVFMRMHPDDVMPSEEVAASVKAVLEDFDARREGAAGYSAEQLSGTRRGETVIGRVADGEEFPGG